MRPPRRWLAGLGAILLTTSGCGPAEERARDEPDIRLVSVEELEAEVASLRGKGLLMNHWATW